LLQITEPDYDSNLEQIRVLFLEYWRWLGFEPCVQNFDEEFKSLPGQYSPPDGCILVALWGSELAGCVALRGLNTSGCEMKRLFVRPAFRGREIGLALASAIIEQARSRGYAYMRLDTLPTMKTAISIYRALNFKEIKPYTNEKIPGARYFELAL